MKQLKPTTPGQRGMSVVKTKHLSAPSVKKLLAPIKRTGGRSSSGRLSVRGRGGGAKRQYRLVDFKRKQFGMEAKVLAFEYDPNRSAWIALIEYVGGEKNYILAPQQLEVGESIISEEKAPLKPGNRLKLKNIPVGTMIYNIELRPGKGGELVRSAGVSAQVLAQEGKYTHLKMPSSEIRKVNHECFATFGQISNPKHRFVNLGKAGRSRHLGRRPKVRGSAMAAVDHPHGGGEGRTGIGLKHPKTKWGKPAYGVKTRRKKKLSNKFILQRRKTIR